MDLKTQNVRACSRLGSAVSGEGPVTGPCEYSNTSRSLRDREFLDCSVTSL